MRTVEMPERPSCETCEHFGKLENIEGGPIEVCRRHAPIAVIDEGEALSIWPSVRPTDRCGDYVLSLEMER